MTLATPFTATLVFAAALSVAAGGCSRQEASAQATSPAERGILPESIFSDGPSVLEGYVADEAICARCHQEIAETMVTMGMGRGFTVPSLETNVEDFSDAMYHHERSGLHYQMETDSDGNIWMNQFQVAPDGRPIHALRQQAQYAVGSGNHARSYLYRTPGGELFELPLSWYHHDGHGFWAMSPGYDTAHHSRTTRPITRECLFCHNAYPDVVAGSDGFGDPHRFPERLPMGLGCQRCHGPAQAHVDLAYSAEASDSEIADSILNPDDLPQPLQVDLCMQCHLQGSSRLASLVRRFGRDDFSYQPGEPLEEYLVHIDYAFDPSTEEFEINHHGLRMQQSACWIESDGAMTCTTCHDPHRKMPAGDRLAFHRGRCLTCHEVDQCGIESMSPDHPMTGTSSDDCVACHMPARRSQDAIHGVVTDHFIRRSPPVEDFLAQIDGDGPPPPGAVAMLHDPTLTDRTPTARLYPLVADANNGRSDVLDELSRLLRETPVAAPDPYMALAGGLMNAGRMEEAVGVFDGVIHAFPELASPRVNKAILLNSLGDPDAAITQLREAIDQDPYLPEAHYDLATLLLAQSSVQEGLSHLYTALELRPHYVEALRLLGNTQVRQGDVSAAAESWSKAMAVDSRDATMAKNLGAAQWLLGEQSEAMRTWTHALVGSPADAPLLEVTALGSMVASDPAQRDHAEGLELAKRAVDAAPRSRKAILAIAIALVLNGDHARGLQAAQVAQQLNADPAAIALLTVLAEADRGQIAIARQLYDQVSSQLQGPAGETMIRRGLLTLARERLTAAP